MKGAKYLLLLPLLIILNHCNQGTFNQSAAALCGSPSANFYSLDMMQRAQMTKNYQYQSPTVFHKFIKNTVVQQLDLHDRCKHTQILIRALQASINQSFTWNNPDNQTSGKIKILDFYPDGCIGYISFITIKNKTRTNKFRACRFRYNYMQLPDEKGYAIPPHLLFAGWFFYDQKYFK